MHILIATGEAYPYSKTGGLADMAGALAKYLAKGGHQVTLVTPHYACVRDHFPGLQPFDWQLGFPMDQGWEEGEILIDEPERNLRVLFISHKRYFHRPGLYGQGGRDYPDNAERFAFFDKAVVNLARYLPDKPDVVHVHDWQTGLVPLLMLHQEWQEGWLNAPRTLLTIHNLAYQGLFESSEFRWTNLPWDYFQAEGVEFYDKLNFLKAAIQFSDRLTTVSPRYAEEILEEPMGCGLSGLLSRRQADLSGILNGVDYSEWRTKRNPHLRSSYDWKQLAGKAREKRRLQQELGLELSPSTPLFGNVTRLTEMKGCDFVLEALELLADREWGFVLLGSGDARFEQAFTKLAASHPGRIAARIGFDVGLSHRIAAACDFYVMPSRFEPSGLNQLYSLRYGAVPVVRATGGLENSIIDAKEDLERANGIKFQEPSGKALAKAMLKALALYESQAWLKCYRLSGMKADFSWKSTAPKYVEIYESLRR